MSFGVIELLVFAVGGSLLLVPLVTLVAIMMQPRDAWLASGHSQLVWGALVFFLPVIGSLAYFVMVHNDVSSHRTMVEMAR